jgi:hypothetical protein
LGENHPHSKQLKAEIDDVSAVMAAHQLLLNHSIDSMWVQQVMLQCATTSWCLVANFCLDFLFITSHFGQILLQYLNTPF